MRAVRYRAFALVMTALLVCANLASAQDLPAGARIIEYDSPAVARSLKYTVLLPDGYAENARRYPVLYLLHGHTGHHTSWLTYAGLPSDTATQLQAIVVLADGGNGFYTNWNGSTESQPQRWEDAIAQDLVAEVDLRWRTRPERGARAIGGLSMGGYGAIAIALHHPDRFGFAFSSAGALRFAARARDEIVRGEDDWNRPELWSKDEKPPVAIPGFATQRERTPRGRVFVTVEHADAADPSVIATRIDPATAPFLHLDCGLQDGLLPETLALADALRTRGLAHALVLLPGDHDTPYWRDAFAHTRLSLQQFFDKHATPSDTGTRP